MSPKRLAMRDGEATTRWSSSGRAWRRLRSLGGRPTLWCVPPRAGGVQARVLDRCMVNEPRAWAAREGVAEPRRALPPASWRGAAIPNGAPPDRGTPLLDGQRDPKALVLGRPHRGRRPASSVPGPDQRRKGRQRPSTLRSGNPSCGRVPPNPSAGRTPGCGVGE